MATSHRKGITDTSQSDLLIKLLVAAEPGGIEAQEAQGQRELVHSDRLPVDTGYGAGDEAYEALGFTFGEPDADGMFRPATLPEGWTRQGSYHAMWSYIVDERGMKRVRIFYKAAFYDRSAHMGLINVGGEVAHQAIYAEPDAAIPIPWDVLTPKEQVDALKALTYMLGQADEFPDIYGKHADRTRALLATAPA